MKGKMKNKNAFIYTIYIEACIYTRIISITFLLECLLQLY